MTEVFISAVVAPLREIISSRRAKKMNVSSAKIAKGRTIEDWQGPPFPLIPSAFIGVHRRFHGSLFAVGGYLAHKKAPSRL